MDHFICGSQDEQRSAAWGLRFPSSAGRGPRRAGAGVGTGNGTFKA